MQFFKTVTTKEHATLLMKELAKQLHPLKGGSPEMWAEVNKQYQEFKEPAPQEQPAPAPAPQRKETPPEVVEKAKFAATLPNVTAEICGTWVWITGNTLEHWNVLKDAGFYYSKKKNACYYHLPEDKIIKRRGKQLEMEEIKNKYGVKQLF